jgi:myo-inositol-1(or 4)-monophosphatase
MSPTDLSASDLQEILAFTTSLARQAGDVILAGSQAILQSGNVDEKKNSVDLVTEYDVKVEELVKGELSGRYPTFQLSVLVLFWFLLPLRGLAYHILEC